MENRIFGLSMFFLFKRPSNAIFLPHFAQPNQQLGFFFSPTFAFPPRSISLWDIV